MDTPDFINVTQADILNSFIKNYEDAYFILTGNVKKLQPAQAEQLLINSGAYECYLHALRIQSAALQGLAQFATYPQLDQICQPFGVIRLSAEPAGDQAEFILNTGHGALVIPNTIRIQSQDGLATFKLIAPIVVAAGIDVVTGNIECDTPGVVGNGYTPGKVSVILDPQPYLASATNIGITAGGSDDETDEAMRERLYLSPSAFSTAGPEDGYIYLAKSASPLIADVSVDNGGGGVVNIYPLVIGGPTPAQVLADVNTACSARDKRPTSDLVNVFSPTVVNYNIDISVIGYTSKDYTTGVANSLAAVQLLADSNGKKLGLDVVRSQISAAASNDALYSVTINAPAADIVVNKTQVAVCTGVNVVLTGFNNDK